jgi:Zn-dependent peptidase ImmA (M78 family)
MAEQIEAIVKPELLIWARRMAGLDTEAAARKTQVSRSKLDLWESGKARPTVAQLRKLADAYKRPLGVFFLEETPAEEPLPPDFRRLNPTQSEAFSPELRLAIRRVHFKRVAALELFEELNEKPQTLAATARSTEAPEAVAERIRELLGFDNSLPKGDMRLQFNERREAVEALGALVFQAEKVSVEEMRAFSIPERPLPAIVLNIKDSPAARSFSLFHELTHVLLGKGGICNLEENGRDSPPQRIEEFCNHVAGAVLIPLDHLRQHPETPRELVSGVSDNTIARLAVHFGVGKETLVRRLAIAKKVPLSFYQAKREEYRRAFASTPKKADGGFAPPSTMAIACNGRLFTRLVVEAYADEKIGASDVLEYLGARVKHLPTIQNMLKSGSFEEKGEP